MDAKYFTKKINWDDNERSLCLSTSMAIWLIVDKNTPLIKAVRSSAKKHGSKQAPTERMVKSILPDDFFAKRRKANMPNGIKATIKDNAISEALTNKFFKDRL